MLIRGFRPLVDAITLAATASSQNTAIGGVGNEMRIDNSANTAQLLWRTSTDSTDSVASTFRCTVAGGAVEVFNINRDTQIAYKLVSGSGNVYITRGEGI